MNLKFDDEAIQNRGSTLNSISGKLIPIFLYLTPILDKYFICVNKDKYLIITYRYSGWLDNGRKKLL